MVQRMMSDDYEAILAPVALDIRRFIAHRMNKLSGEKHMLGYVLVDRFARPLVVLAVDVLDFQVRGRYLPI